MFDLRDKDRYGHFKAYSDELGDVEVCISISGFGEKIEVFKDGNSVFFDETVFSDYEDEDGNVESDFGFEECHEDDECFLFVVGYPYYKDVEIKKSTMKRIDTE